MKALLAAFCLVAVPLGVAAQSCPTRADLAGGVQLVRDDPFFSVVFTAIPEGLAEARVMERDGRPQAVDTTYAHALAVATRRAGGGTLSVAYGEDPEILDTLPSLRSWSTDVSLTADGAPYASGTYTATITGFGAAEIGACTYDVWRVRDVLDLDTGATILFEKSYAPDLGLVVGSIRLDAAGQPTGSVFFDRIAAE